MSLITVNGVPTECKNGDVYIGLPATYYSEAGDAEPPTGRVYWPQPEHNPEPPQPIDCSSCGARSVPPDRRCS